MDNLYVHAGDEARDGSDSVKRSGSDSGGESLKAVEDNGYCGGVSGQDQRREKEHEKRGLSE